MVVFDCETSPNEQKARELMPVFDEADIKLGNLKDEAKIKEKIAEARASHESNWMDKAALRPELAEILAIGYYHPDLGIILKFERDLGGERELLEDFWKRHADYHKQTGEPFAGWNSNSFDVPMIVLRSRLLGVYVPAKIRQGRYFNSSMFHDLRDDWLLGRKETEVKSSLDYVAKAFGLPGKNGNGKDFAKLYRANNDEAYSYLYNDIHLTLSVARKLGHPIKPTTETFEEWLEKYISRKDERPDF